MKMHRTQERKSSLEIYFNEMRKNRLLSREEEKKYAISMASGDKNAREKLINSNLSFVISTAKKYQGRGLSIEDLISEGNAGLIKAADKFDLNKGDYFIAYAQYWIKHEILIAIHNQSRQIRLPVKKSLLVNKLKRRFENSEGPYYEKIQKIAKEFDIKEMLIEELLNLSNEMVSIDKPIHKKSGNDEETFEPSLEDKIYNSPEKSTIESCLKKEINDLLNRYFSQRDKNIIEERFGFNGKGKYSLKELGEKYGLAKERIRQRELRFLDKIDKPQNREKLVHYWED